MADHELVIPNMLIESVPVARFEAVAPFAGRVLRWYIEDVGMVHHERGYPSKFDKGTRISVPMPRGHRVAAMVERDGELFSRYSIPLTEREPIMSEDPPASPTEPELNLQLTELSADMLSACERYVREPSAEAFKAWMEANGRYVEKHRLWWALVNPDVDYQSVFGSAELVQTVGTIASPIDITSQT